MATRSTHQRTIFLYRLICCGLLFLNILLPQKSPAAPLGSCATLWDALEQTSAQVRTQPLDTSGMDTHIAERPTSEMLQMLNKVARERRASIRSHHVRYLKRLGPSPNGRISIWELPDNSSIELSPNQIYAMPEQVRSWLQLASP